VAKGKRPQWGILTIDAITFETELQHSRKQLRFSIPSEVARLIGVERSKKRLYLHIYHKRRLIFKASKPLTSGTEITGAQMKAKGLSAGDRIRVQVSRH
jgi:hypothetical protein